MYYVTGVSSSKICVRDTKDGVSEWIDAEYLRKLNKAGVVIEGISTDDSDLGFMFDEFCVSLRKGRSIVASKYALGMGVSFDLDSISKCVVDLSKCKRPCVVCLDDLFAEIDMLDFYFSRNLPEVTIKIGSGVLSSSLRVLTSELADVWLGNLTIDISDANDSVFDNVYTAFSNARSNMGSFKMGDRGIMHALEEYVFFSNTRFVGCQLTDSVYFDRKILRNKELNQRFLDEYRSELMIPAGAICCVSEYKFLKMETIRRELLRLKNYSQFIDFMRANYYFVESEHFDDAYAEGVSLGSVWSFFYLGGDDSELYDRFIYAVRRMEIV